jgi:hypothetical protein
MFIINWNLLGESVQLSLNLIDLTYFDTSHNLKG